MEAKIDVMLPKNRPPAHPGEMLAEEFLEPMGMSRAELARRTGISARVLGALIRKERGVTAQIATSLAQTFGTSSQFWMNLQEAFDRWHICPQCGAPMKVSVEDYPYEWRGLGRVILSSIKVKRCTKNDDDSILMFPRISDLHRVLTRAEKKYRGLSASLELRVAFNGRSWAVVERPPAGKGNLESDHPGGVKVRP